MSRALLLFVLSSAMAGAQVAPPRAPTGGDRAILVAGALVGGAVALPTGPFLVVGAGVGTYAASALLDLDPTVGGVLIDTAVGAGVAVAVGGGTLWLITEVGGADADFSASIGSVLIGLVVGSAAVGAVHGARLAWLRADARLDGFSFLLTPDPVRPLFLLLVLAVPAGAPDRPAPPQRIAVVAGGVLGGAGALAGTVAALRSDADAPAGVALGTAAYVVGTAAGVALFGEILGLGAPFEEVLLDAALGVPVGVFAGAMVGLAVAGITYVVIQDGWGVVSGLTGGGVGLVVMAVTVPLVASNRLRVTPAALAAPEAGRAPGLRLALGL